MPDQALDSRILASPDKRLLDVSEWLAGLWKKPNIII
jgi:hypothetical protein